MVKIIIVLVNTGLVGKGIKIGLFPLDIGLKIWLWSSYSSLKMDTPRKWPKKGGNRLK
jgi:hypothetical protein